MEERAEFGEFFPQVIEDNFSRVLSLVANHLLEFVPAPPETADSIKGLVTAHERGGANRVPLDLQPGSAVLRKAAQQQV
ncbi:hypothetical protein D3C84_1037540 [compost metagenome]